MVVIYGMSGSGKDSILDGMKSKYGYTRVLSFMTREGRPGEVHGENCYLFSKEEAQEKISNNEVAQWVNQGGVIYGTLKKDYLNSSNKIAIMNPQALEDVRNNEEIGGIIGIYIERPEGDRVSSLKERKNYKDRPEVDDNIRKGKDLADFVVVNDGTIEEAVDKIHNIVKNMEDKR